MWKRIELHNHTVESDGVMTAEELARYLYSCGICSFSLTDHNTVSGWQKLPEACKNLPAPMEFVSGLELTTFYGHLLCQNVSSYIPWEDIDPDNADILFERIHAAGGLAGPAHPFSVPSPFSNGMCWTMKIHDYRLVDFIEIINNAHPMEPDNKKAILWWEQLVFKGYAIAPVAGTDLHRPESMEGFYTTYIEGADGDLELPLADQLSRAVRDCRTCVTRGPAAGWRLEGRRLSVFLHPAGRDFYKRKDISQGGMNIPAPPPPFLCQIRTETRTVEQVFRDGICRFDFSEDSGRPKAATIMIYEHLENCPEETSGPDWDRLTAVAGPVFLK